MLKRYFIQIVVFFILFAQMIVCHGQEEQQLGHWEIQPLQTRRTKRSTLYSRKAPIITYPGEKIPKEYLTMFTMNDRPIYCIEPMVPVIFQEDGGLSGPGPTYSSTSFYDLDEQTRNTIGRIIWYGYGNPMSGTTDAYYLATTLLIWQHVSPLASQRANQILSTANWCDGSQYCSSTKGKVDVQREMDQIMDLVNHHDKVPSFASEWHQTMSYGLDWDKTLVLTDTQGILDWFEEDSVESHQGIHLKKEGQSLLIDIDELYYEGYQTSQGKTLTFLRKQDQFENYLNGILLWTSGENQKLMSGSFTNPTPSFTLSFYLNRGEIEIEKQNEFYQPCYYANGTKFMVGWYQDPEKQYHKDGGKDENWKAYHDFEKETKDDIYGLSNQTLDDTFYYPIKNKNGEVQLFEITDGCRLKINQFLPSNQKWWIKEVSSSVAYQVDSHPFLAETKNPGEKNSYQFVNALKDVKLTLQKKDAEDNFKWIDGAVYKIYDISQTIDLDKSPTQLGYQNPQIAQLPWIGFETLKKYTNLQVNDQFEDTNYRYKIVEIKDDTYKIQATKKTVTIPYDTYLSRYQVQDPSQKKINVKILKHYHGTMETIDDEIETFSYRIISQQNYLKKIYIDIQDFQNIANDSLLFAQINDKFLQENIPFETNQGVEVDDFYYQIKDMLNQETIFHRYLLARIDEEDVTPIYSDLPHPRTLQPNEQFFLSYVKENKVEKQMFTVVENRPDKIVLKTPDEKQIDVVTPIWLEKDDIPQRISYDNQFQIQKIIYPTYKVKDSFDNLYLVTDQDTTLLQQGTIQFVSKPDYALVTGQSQDEPKTSGCYLPKQVEECPIGTTKTKKVTYEKTNDNYTFSYDVIKGLVSEESNTIFYPIEDAQTLPLNIVEKADDHYVLSFIKEEELYSFRISQDEKTTPTATIEVENTYHILETTPKSFQVNWLSMDTYPYQNFHHELFSLVKFFPKTLQLTYSDLQEKQVGQTFIHQELEYRILRNYSSQRQAIVESKYGVYLIDEQQGTYFQPIQYDDILQKEIERNEVFLKGDIFSIQIAKKPMQTDVVTIENMDYYIQSYQYTMVDPITSTKSQVLQNTLIVGWLMDTPLNYQQILQQDHLEFEYENKHYQFQPMNQDQLVGMLIDKDTQKSYPFYQMTVFDKLVIDQDEQSTSFYIRQLDENSSFQMEDIYFFLPNKTYDLKTFFPEYQTFTLQSQNRYVTLDDNQFHAKNITTGELILQNDMQSKKVRYVIDQTEKHIQGLMQMVGETGKQYLRTTDVQNHHMPLKEVKVDVFSADHKTLIKSFTSDAFGAVDISDLPENDYTYTYLDQSGLFQVLSKERVKGTLSIPKLKWGRTYIACEIKLPKGYDYQQNQVCHTFTLDSNLQEIVKVVENRKRRLEVEVVKVDQFETTKKLNGAVFTVENITNKNRSQNDLSSTKKHTLDIDDLLPIYQQNDTYYLWKTARSLKKHIYRIETITDEMIGIVNFDQNKPGKAYWISKKGFDYQAPMLYEDILKVVKTPRGNQLFYMYEKEPVTMVEEYQIIAIAYNHDHTQIEQATLKNKKRDGEVIRLQRYEKEKMFDTNMLGKYISGGILITQSETVPQYLSLKRIIQQYPNIKENDTIESQSYQVRKMPSYEEVVSLCNKQPCKFVYDDVEYEELERKYEEKQLHMKLKAFTQNIIYSPNTVIGSIGFYQKEIYQVEQVVRQNESIVSLILKDSNNQTFYIDETTKDEITQGKCGVLAKVYNENHQLIQLGYTNQDGEIRFMNLKDGDYQVEVQGRTNQYRVEQGKIVLPEIPYGTKLEACEIESPVGYIVQKKCHQFVIEQDDIKDVVVNKVYNPQAKIILKKQRSKVKKWKLGIA